MNGLIKGNKKKIDHLHKFNLGVLIDKISIKFPSKIAIYDEKDKITYSQLKIKSQKIANCLKEKGVKKNDLVGIYMDRKIDTILIMIGLLKIGAAFLPFDKNMPKKRIGYIINDAKLNYICIDEKDEDYFKDLNVKTFCYDKKMDYGKELINNKEIEVNKETIVYAIYTSGSTGNPKGVEITHKSLLNFLESMKDKPGITDRDHFLSLTTFAFDISIMEVFLPLYSGATLTIASEKEVIDSSKIYKKIDENKISIIQATPITWKNIIEYDWEKKKNIKALCGGEELSEKLAANILKKCTELWNMYGPTETTIWSSIEKVEQTNENISIGKPIYNTNMYIFNESLKIVEEGEIGELYIGGDGVAKGYINDNEKNKVNFINNPINKKEVIYKTGDLVKLLPNGKLEYVSRNDNQIKFRGFRIELQEIERNSEKIIEISKAVVTPCKKAEENKILCMFYELEKNKKISNHEIDIFLKERLPDYMIPSMYIELDKIPLTHNNKIDRKKLEEFEISKNSRVKNDFSLTIIQKQVKDIWIKLMKTNEISINDKFLEIGGHSLLATRIVSQVQKNFEIELSMLEFIMDGSTIKKLSSLISKKKNIVL